MAQSGFTPLQLYYSSTTTNVPTSGNLLAGELALNTADGKLFYKDSSNVVQVIGTKGGVGSSTTTQVLYNSSGLVVGSANLTFNGTKLSINTQGIANYGDYTAISAPTYAEGRFWYDTTKKALTYYNDATGNAVHVGLETQVKVINNTGSTIAIGSPVYITGTSSGQSYPNIALAKADVSGTSAVIGLTNTAIANGAIGYVTSNGAIDGVNTNSYTVGQVLYLSPYSAGQLQNTVPPTGLIVQVGVVSYVNSSGSIYVKQTQPLILATTQGGTGLTTYTAGDLTYYASGTAFSKLGIGTAGQILTSSGTAPQWSTLTGVAVTTFSAGTTGFTPSSATSGAVTLAGTLITSNGGTGLTTFTAGDLPYYATGTALSKLGIGTANYVLTSSGSAPQYVAQSTLSVGTATNVAGGTTGAVHYQSGVGATTFLSIGTAGQILTVNSGATAPQYVSSLTTAQGGTGLTSFTAGDLVYFSTGTAFTKLGIGTAGQVLTVNTGATAPQWSTTTVSGVTTISFGSTGLTPSTATSGAVSVAGTLAFANGGTGATTVSAAQTNLQVDPAGTAVAMAIALG